MKSAPAAIRPHSGAGSPGPRVSELTTSIGVYSAAPISAPGTPPPPQHRARRAAEQQAEDQGVDHPAAPAAFASIGGVHLRSSIERSRRFARPEEMTVPTSQIPTCRLPASSSPASRSSIRAGTSSRTSCSTGPLHDAAGPVAPDADDRRRGRRRVLRPRPGPARRRPPRPHQRHARLHARDAPAPARAATARCSSSSRTRSSTPSWSTCSRRRSTPASRSRSTASRHAPDGAAARPRERSSSSTSRRSRPPSSRPSCASSSRASLTLDRRADRDAPRSTSSARELEFDAYQGYFFALPELSQTPRRRPASSARWRARRHRRQHDVRGARGRSSAATPASATSCCATPTPPTSRRCARSPRCATR